MTELEYNRSYMHFVFSVVFKRLSAIAELLVKILIHDIISYLLTYITYSI